MLEVVFCKKIRYLSFGSIKENYRLKMYVRIIVYGCDKFI